MRTILPSVKMSIITSFSAHSLGSFIDNYTCILEMLLVVAPAGRAFSTFIVRTDAFFNNPFRSVDSPFYAGDKVVVVVYTCRSGKLAPFHILGGISLSRTLCPLLMAFITW
jgi:hypothetical protein